MDPKSTTLDPKLKEVYDRVMGTSATPGTAPQAAHPTPPVVPPPATQPPVHAPEPAAASAFPPPKSSLDSSAPAKSAVDYAALAAKYATPPPPLGDSPASSTPSPIVNSTLGGSSTPPPSSGLGQVAPAPAHVSSAKDPAVATFSATVQVPTNSAVPASKNSSSLLKIALFVGVPIFLIAYTVVWMVVFKVDITKFIPGA